MRVLNDPPCSGVVNMARDEALLTLAGSDAPATLRLYGWSEPTISLGYFQRYGEYEVLPLPAGELPVVRRITGGGAILHDRELTYSLTMPADRQIVARRPDRLYEIVHQALITCLGESGIDAHCNGRTDSSGPAKGPFFCFSRRHRFDLLIESAKVAGSAQRRTRGAILQHGSIMFENRYHQQRSAALGALGIDLSVLRRRFPVVLARLVGAKRFEDSWASEELEAAGSLEGKYADPAWTRRR